MKIFRILFGGLLLFCSFTQAQTTSDYDYWRKNGLKLLKKQQVIILPALQREGCEFVEWNTKQDGTGTSYKAGEQFTPSEDITLYAIWNKKETPNDEPVDEPNDEPVDEPNDEPVDEPNDEPVDEPNDEPVDEPNDEPVDEPNDEPVDEPNDEPVDEPNDEPVDEPNDEPVDEPNDEPVDNTYIQPEPISETICKGETYTLGGKTFDRSGDYKIVLGKFKGSDVDSIQQLHLLVAEPSQTTLHDTISIAAGMYKGNGFSIDHLSVGETTYTSTYKNQYGCDSTVTLELNVKAHTVYGEDLNEAICENDTFVYNDSTYKPGKTYILHETTALGYDSVVYLNIKSLPTSMSIVSATVTLGDSYTENGFELPEQEKEGMFYHQLTTINNYGCDSTVTLLLKVTAPKDTITIPTLFTPHSNNGKNDIFMEGYEVYIYDRYSNLICHSTNGWKGIYKGKIADPGVYIYTVILKDNRKKRGTIELYK